MQKETVTKIKVFIMIVSFEIFKAKCCYKIFDILIAVIISVSPLSSLYICTSLWSIFGFSHPVLASHIAQVVNYHLLSITHKSHERLFKKYRKTKAKIENLGFKSKTSDSRAYKNTNKSLPRTKRDFTATLQVTL